MADNAFKGRDRRLVSQTWRNLRAVILRDRKAVDPKKTLELSTRELILDNDFTLVGETYLANMVLIQLRVCYFLPSPPPTYTGVWPPPVGQ